MTHVHTRMRRPLLVCQLQNEPLFNFFQTKNLTVFKRRAVLQMTYSNINTINNNNFISAMILKRGLLLGSELITPSIIAL